MTDIHPTPNRNDPPRILLPTPSDPTIVTPDPGAVFLLSPSATPPYPVSRDVRVDVADSDDELLEVHVFAIGGSTPAVDAGMPQDGGTTDTVVRRLVSPPGAAFRLNASHRGIALATLNASRDFVETGRCYSVEIRISSHFATDEAYEPAEPGDVASITYWVGSFGPSTTAIDLADCRRQQ